MPSFYLQSIDEDGSTTTKSFESCYVAEVVEYLDDFLRGSGFSYNELKVVQSTDDSDDGLTDNIRKTFLKEEYQKSYRASQSPTE
tara:strand:- start:398 stop:652 length:255 start_codon:yes stop_codon:yes gene_type:complete